MSVDAAGQAERRAGVPRWVLGAVPLAFVALAFLAFALFSGGTLPERTGPPVEELAVERTVLRPGEIELTVRNPGADAVRVAQVSVSDAFVDFRGAEHEIGRLSSERLTLDYPWQEGSPYTISLLTSTGATIEHTIDVAVETPDSGPGFYGLMALLGTYVGVVPVLLGMLFLPFLARVAASWIRVLMAATVGLLGFLALDGTLEGLELSGEGSGAFGGAELLFVGAGAAFLGLTALDAHMRARRERARDAGSSPYQLSLLVAIGIGLHNLGEGLAIGSAYAVGSLALGAFLVIGFAIHNTTEGLAIVAPLARGERPSLARLGVLGLIAGGPAILGAFVGASAFNPELAALLIGVGVGAIAQVIVQLLPSLRDAGGRALNPSSVAGIAAGALFLYGTGLLVSV